MHIGDIIYLIKIYLYSHLGPILVPMLFLKRISDCDAVANHFHLDYTWSASLSRNIVLLNLAIKSRLSASSL